MMLHGIISNILQNKLKLYSAFVDFRKAFDKLNRKILIYKLLRNGLSTKFVAMVKSTYSSLDFVSKLVEYFQMRLITYLVLNKETTIPFVISTFYK